MDRLSIVILTFNCENGLPATLAAARRLSDDIHAVDSFSTDRTVSILEEYGVNYVQRPFNNYADQRNWSMENLRLRGDWQLHLDADEILSQGLIDEIAGLLRSGEIGKYDGYFIPRRIRFLGQELMHGGYYPIYHMRLFRKGYGRVESKLYDQHFVLSGNGRPLRHLFIDDQTSSLAEWTNRHNRWSSFEAAEITQSQVRPDDQRFTIKPLSDGNVLERMRARKQSYMQLPILLRPFLLFLYRYVIRLGFLDGKPGLIYCVLQAFWFRFLIDAKIYERRSGLFNVGHE